MAQVETVVTELELDGVSEFERGMASAGGSVDSFQEITIGALREIGAISVDAFGALASAALDVAGAALGGLTDFISGAIGEAIEGEKNFAKLEQTIKSTGGAAGLTAEEAQALANQFANLAGGSDDAVIAIEELALRSGNISADEMPAFIQASLDLGTVMGDNAAAARLLAMAQDDPLAAFKKVERATGAYDTALEEQIKALQDSGDNAGALALVMESLSETTGGAAAANAETFAGKMEVMNGRIGEAVEAIGAAFLPILEELFTNVIEPSLPIIEQFAANIAAAIQSFAASPEAQAAMEILKAAITDISEFFGVFITALEGGRDPLDAIGLAIRAAFPPEIETVLMSIFDAVVGLVALVEQAWPTIAAAGQVVVDFIMDTLLPGFMALVDWTVANWPTIQSTISDVMNFILDLVGIVLTGVQEFWTAHGDEIMETVSTFMAFVSDTVSTILTAIQGWWADHGDSVTAVISGLVTTVSELWGTWFTFLYDTVSTALGLIQEFWANWGDEISLIVGALFEAVGLLFDAFAAAFAGDWTTFGETLRTAWDTVWAAIQTTVSTIFEWFAAQDWGAIAQGIVDGIISGLETGGAALNQALQDMAANALEAAKAFLGIQSPSKLFAAQVGEQISAGMAEGILDGASDVIDAAAQTAGAASSAASIAVGGMAGASAAPPVAGFARGALGSTSNVNKTVNVYPNYSQYQTPPEVAFDVELALAAM